MTETTEWSTRARSFGPAAQQYDRHRPTYPAEALRWALGDQPLRVVDLGAGTGIVSRQLVALGYEVVPVEPDDEMRAQLAEASPGLRPLAGYAEQIPLPDGSADAVVAGQAYHWFDPEPAHAEIARVLRPGGVFSPLWNALDKSVSWVAALSAIDGSERGARPIPEGQVFGAAFGPVTRASFRHTVSHTPQTLTALLQTHSAYLIASPQRQTEIVERVRALCATHPDLAGRDRFDLPYQTSVLRAVRLG